MPAPCLGQESSMRLVQTVLMTVLLITMDPGCGSDVKPDGPGDSCKVPGDCKDGQICVRGVCKVASSRHR